MPRRALAAFVLLLAAFPAAAQPTNAEVIARLAADCLADVPPDAFVLTADLAPYLHTALIGRWQQAERRVFSDSLAAYPHLRLGTPAATIAYSRAGRGRFGRTVRLALPYTLTSPEGEILRTGTCDQSIADMIERRALARLEDAAHPETVGARPAPGWAQRYAEPFLLGSAVVVSTLLFFSLRSR